MRILKEDLISMKSECSPFLLLVKDISNISFSIKSILEPRFLVENRQLKCVCRQVNIQFIQIEQDYSFDWVDYTTSNIFRVYRVLK